MNSEPVAVVGMGCVLPDAFDVIQFWERTRRAECSIRPLAGEIWDIRDAELSRYAGGWIAFEKARDEGRRLPDPVSTALSLTRPADVPARAKPQKPPNTAARPARAESG